MTVKEIKNLFRNQKIELLPEIIEKYNSDPRKGVKKICAQYQRKYEKYLEEQARVAYMIEFDEVFAGENKYIVAGIDEAGRGPLAGPVVAASVILPYDIKLSGINDSKKLNEKQREILYDEITDKAIAVGVGVVDAKEIDHINILQATLKAMKKAVINMGKAPDVILVDGNQTIPDLKEGIVQHKVIGGDYKSIAIASASIIAKVTRDRIMLKYDEEYPEYCFKSNKGYGSSSHREAIKRFGPTDIHRRTFLKAIYKNRG